jgi:ketosteroid isomerase-like protein
VKTDSLRINQLSPADFERYLGYLRAIDEGDVDSYAAFLADDCELIQNNNPPVRGKAAIVGMLAQFWPAFRGMEHELLNIYGTAAHFVLEAWNHYTRHDGSKVSVRAVAFTDRDETTGFVTSVRFYTDASPVFAP